MSAVKGQDAFWIKWVFFDGNKLVKHLIIHSKLSVWFIYFLNLKVFWRDFSKQGKMFLEEEM